MKLERITHFRPAYDKRSDVPSKNYGIGSVTCIMVLKGPKGAVHFSFSTGILLESTMVDYIKDGRAKYESHDWGIYYLNKPMGYDVGYHSPKPMWKGQELRHPTKIVTPKGKKIGEMKPEEVIKSVKFKKVGKLPVCEWIGKPCYCDGSAMQAEEWFNIFVEKGSDTIWKMMEKEYEETFGKKSKK